MLIRIADAQASFAYNADIYYIYSDVFVQIFYDKFAIRKD